MNPAPRPWSHLHPQGQSYLPLQDDRIHYAGQPIALVVAATLDQAAYAGTLDRDRLPGGAPRSYSAGNRRARRRSAAVPLACQLVRGRCRGGNRGRRVRIEQTYTTSDRHHNPMEPHVTTAVWDADGRLTLYETTQYIFGARELVSIVLGLPREKITSSPTSSAADLAARPMSGRIPCLAAVAAKVLNRPVRVQLTRAQMYSMVGHQPATIQTIALGASEDGRLTGIRHDSLSPTSVFDNYIEYAANWTRSLWAPAEESRPSTGSLCEPRHADGDARAHEALGHFALECAMDELAYATGVDPVELRLPNDTDIDPYSGRPFSTRAMRKCLTEGAARFGWEKRTPGPRSMRDGAT